MIVPQAAKPWAKVRIQTFRIEVITESPSSMLEA
jgi:hypothetical protein